EYLPADAIAQTVQKINPEAIAIREAALKVIDAYMKADNQIRIQYASKQARIANAWKKWQGENLGIEKSGAIAIKKAQEAEFTKQLKAKGLDGKYGNILSNVGQLYKEIEAVNVKRTSFMEVFLRTNELTPMLFGLTQLEGAAANSEAAFEKQRDANIGRMKGVYKE